MASSGRQRRWRQWSEAEARAALAELDGSGESAKRFASRKGVSTQRLAYWRKRLADSGTTFVAVPLPEAGRGGHVEIALDGVVVRVREEVEVDHVARLVVAIARRARC
jgi:hypothetical protein